MRIRTLKVVSEGVQRNGKMVTKEILQECLEEFNGEARPPVTLGHPWEGDDKIPALGRVSSPRLELNDKEKLELVIEVIYTKELEEFEDSLKFEGFSIGIHARKDTGKYYIHHLAALGQLPPAAEIQTKEIVELSSTTKAQNIIYLSCAPKKPNPNQNKDNDMDKDQKIKELEAQLKKLLDQQSSNKEQEEIKSLKAKLQAKEDEKKAQIEANAKEKKDELLTKAKSSKLSENEQEAVKNLLEKPDDVELSDNSASGFYSNVNVLIDSLSKKKSNSNHAHLNESIELSDPKNGASSTDSMVKF